MQLAVRRPALNLRFDIGGKHGVSPPVAPRRPSHEASDGRLAVPRPECPRPPNLRVPSKLVPDNLTRCAATVLDERLFVKQRLHRVQRTRIFSGGAQQSVQLVARQARWRGGGEACDPPGSPTTPVTTPEKKQKRKECQSQYVLTCKETQEQQAALCSRGSAEL